MTVAVLVVFDNFMADIDVFFFFFVFYHNDIWIKYFGEKHEMLCQ